MTPIEFRNKWIGALHGTDDQRRFDADFREMIETYMPASSKSACPFCGERAFTHNHDHWSAPTAVTP